MQQNIISRKKEGLWLILIKDQDLDLCKETDVVEVF